MKAQVRPPAPEPLLDLAAAAARLGVSRWTVRRLIDTGALPVVRLPGRRGVVRRLLVEANDVETLISASKEQEPLA